MIKTYLIGLIIFSAIKIGAVIITKYHKKTLPNNIFLKSILDCVLWPIPCFYFIYLLIKEIKQQRFIKKIRASKLKSTMSMKNWIKRNRYK